MKIQSLSITNFRGIREVVLNDLGSMVIVAGQNGSGKSCIFDAIRLLKSVYGGYQQNEWQQWMGEFSIQISNRSSDFTSMFNDRSRELRIIATFQLAEEERRYITAQANELLREMVWRTVLPEAYEWGGYRMAMFAAQFREREPEVQKKVDELKPALVAELAAPSITGQCFIPVGGIPMIVNSVALQVIFSTFRPREIGVIDYHGAQRHYTREYVTGVNLDLDANKQQKSQSTLYNAQAKYQGVKSEMASSYLRELLTEKAGGGSTQADTLTQTLQELFASFFPDKEFLGPQPTASGGLSFPVKTSTGGRHDLDELSAGEKEILYGYLRIRNSAPRYSVILLDEPELHLNPRLIRGLPQFYQRNLGEALGNQIWLVTHSDALLREVVGRDGYNVFHMLPCGSVRPGESQLKPLKVTADLELALIDLVGDLASYRPGGKVVIFESGGDADFDRRVAATLFPQLTQHANLISGSNKARVKALHEILDRAATLGQLPFQFYAITDKDFDTDAAPSKSVNTFAWDVYHIENYFISPSHIASLLASLAMGNPPDQATIFDELRECARQTMPQLLRHELAEVANGALMAAIRTGTDPSKGDLAGELHAAVMNSIARLKAVEVEVLSRDKLETQEQELRAKYEAALADGSWVSIFRGRDILKRFVAFRRLPVSYEVFRNLILARMANESFQPPGMKAVIDKVMA
ncbi:MAG TPA: AAA family ATPase [Hyphomicrobium sp.]|jgi:predicted ATPase|nr:AAA family ATPase [Hyphomicrobium sp.]